MSYLLYQRKGALSIAYSQKAVDKWRKSNTKAYSFSVMIKTEQDIIEKLESVPNKAGYIKALIRADIAKEK